MTTGRTLEWGPGRVAVIDYVLRPGPLTITDGARLVYLALYSYMDERCLCFPKVATIAAGTGISERTVQRRLDELEEAGLLRSNRGELSKKGRGRESAVFVLCPPWEPRPPTDRCQPDTCTAKDDVPDPCEKDR